MDNTGSILELAGATNSWSNLDVTGAEGGIKVDSTETLTICSASTTYDSSADFNVFGNLNLGTAGALGSCPGILELGTTTIPALITAESGGIVNFNNEDNTHAATFVEEAAGSPWTLSGQFIDVNGGTLNYNGDGTHKPTDQVGMPIKVENGGTFVASGGSNTNLEGSELQVSGYTSQTNSNSVYMTGSSSQIELESRVTLFATNGYSQSNGTLECGDSTEVELNPGSGTNGGTVTITGGFLQPNGPLVDGTSNYYGTMDINGNLTMSGGTFYTGWSSASTACGIVLVGGNFNGNGAKMDGYEQTTGGNNAFTHVYITLDGTLTNNFSTIVNADFPHNPVWSGGSPDELED
jgi:hypothetical protein